jgi:xanthine dehydrogenase accessory factor
MFDRDALAAALTHGPVARVVVAEVHGSTPREVGAAMLVWAGGQAGTIGGGALEWEAAEAARAMLGTAGPPHPIPPPQGGREVPSGPSRQLPGHGTGAAARGVSLPPRGGGTGWGGGTLSRRVTRIPLGPALGQCCGGAVTLWTEVWTAVPAGPVIARGPGEMPLAVARILDSARGQGVMPATALVRGWLVEPVARTVRHLWVWGAGHVGRAVVGVVAPLPGVAVTWVDVAPDRFPDEVPHGVAVLTDPSARPPATAEHLVMTFSHALDLEICHRLLTHGFASLGLIGSATKAARFRSRLAALGHSPASIARIRCPIGDPALGKHPQAIAIGVAAAFLAAPIAVQRTATA